MARDNRQNTKERVEVFDRQWDWNKENNRHHDGGYFFGVILILIGVFLIFNSLGYISWNVWNYVWPFWPLLLVIWGIQIILGRNQFSRFIVGVITLIALGLVLLFGVTRVNPAYKNNLTPQINNMLNQMDIIQIKETGR